MATYSNRPLLLDNILFDYLLKNSNETLDDTKLKRLSTILSNIPYNILKQAYDNYLKKLQFEKICVQDIKPNQNELKYIEITNQSNAYQTQTYQTKSYRKQLNDLNTSPDLNSNIIVIHVCDEAKQLKKDFQCPRDLLIREMKYFSNSMNLNTNSSNLGSNSAMIKRNLEDMDISVHCDINIFEWLMKYVKRNIRANEDSNETESKEPKLEVTNCVSILISSDFLIMHELVDKCLLFMVENIAQVLQIPCNLNTINDRLITKIAAFIKLHQLDDIPEKKEKFKTKLYMKKIEFYFDCDKYRRQFEYHDNDDDTSYIEFDGDDTMSLFRCKICGRVLTQKQSRFIKCQLGLLDKRGNYNYFHVSDEKFDINLFIIDLKDKLKTWQNVFWFLWGLMKCARCTTCKEWFRFADLTKCLVNSNAECPVHRSGVKKSITLTLKPLSGVNEPPVEVKAQSCSCQYKDHTLDTTSFGIYYPFYPQKQPQSTYFNQYLLDALYKHKETMCHGNGLVLGANKAKDGSINFCSLIENQYQPAQDSNIQPLVTNCFIDSITGQHISFFSKPYLSLLSLSNNSNSNETTQLPQMDITEYLKTVVLLDPLNAFNSYRALSFLKIDLKKKWDQTKAPRWNQDNQREDDTRRFREIGSYLFKLRSLLDQNIAALTQKLNNKPNNNQTITSRDPSGGYYARIENEWKLRQSSATNPSYFSQFSLSNVNTNNQFTSLSSSGSNSNQFNNQSSNSGSGGFNKQQQQIKMRQGSIAPLNKFS